MPCQMLLKCLKLYLKLQNHHQKVRKVMDRSWLIHESPGLKSDWLGDIKLFSVRNAYILLYKILSNIFPATRRKDIGRFEKIFGSKFIIILRISSLVKELKEDKRTLFPKNIVKYFSLLLKICDEFITV